MTDATNPTTRLYWNDAYLTAAAGRVVDVDGRQVVLEATPFHAHGGGQPGDTGTLEAVRVLDARKSNDEMAIVHILETDPPFASGDEVSARIDWPRRYGLMRHHTLLHLVHLGVQEVAGAIAPGGTHITEQKARIEYPCGPLDIDAVQAIVREMSAGNLTATTSIGTDGIRRWEIPGYPPIPCGGTHVRYLSELAHIDLGTKSAGKRGIRIYATSTLSPLSF